MLWRLNLFSGYTVNNTKGNRPINIINAFYNIDGSCCSLAENKVIKSSLKNELIWFLDMGFNDQLEVRIPDTEENAMQIYDPSRHLCLSISTENSAVAIWEDCNNNNKETLFIRNGDNTIESYIYPKVYLSFLLTGHWLKKEFGYGFGYLNESSSNNIKWQMEFYPNRWIH